MPTTTSSSCVMKSTTASAMFRPADSLTPRTLIAASSTMMSAPTTMSPGRRAQRLPEQPADVVRHEERRDRDRDDVVEHLAPGGEEGPELVERVARERRRAARLGVHRRRLGVRRGGAEEDHAGDDEDDRRQAERERGDEPERVVDRRADVAVGGREERVDPEHALQSVEPAFSHPRRESTPETTRSAGCATPAACYRARPQRARSARSAGAHPRGLRLLDELEERLERDVPAERVAAGRQLLLPVQAEVAPVDDRRQLERRRGSRGSAGRAGQADPAARRDRLRVAVDRQLARSR